MNITILTNEYPPNIYGGAGVHVEYLTKELARLDEGAHRVDVFCFGSQDVREENLRVRGIEPNLDLPAQDPRHEKFLDTVLRDVIMAGSVADADVERVQAMQALLDKTGTQAGEVDLWDDHRLVTVNSSGITVTEVTYSPSTSGLGRSTSTVAGATAMSEFGMTLSELKQNIANWYSYGRRRSLVAKASIGSVLESNPDYRYGLSVRRGADRDERRFQHAQRGPVRCAEGFRLPRRGHPAQGGTRAHGPVLRR